MGQLAFHQVAASLYVAAGGPPAATAVYWVLLDGQPPAGDLTPADTWTYAGCHVFVPATSR